MHIVDVISNHGDATALASPVREERFSGDIIRQHQGPIILSLVKLMSHPIHSQIPVSDVEEINNHKEIELEGISLKVAPKYYTVQLMGQLRGRETIGN